MAFTAPALAEPSLAPHAHSQGGSPATQLTPGAAPDSFDFETEQIKGTIQLQGKYHGVTRLIDKRTGRQVIDPRYSALNLFKLMSVNQFLDQPRTMPRTTTVASDWVEAKWAASESHKAELSARYEVKQPNAIDLTVTVRSQGAYRGYELFLSSYFDKAFEPHVYLWTRGRKNRDLAAPTVNDVFRGAVLVFPRDAHAARRCVDGRWDRNERGAPTVQMCPVRHYAYCMAVMVFPAENPAGKSPKRLGVVLMSRPQDCYAISTRYHAEKPADRLTSYSAFDLSLFGDNLLPHDERTVKIRLAVTELDNDFSQPLQLYNAFLAETNTRLAHPRLSESKE